MEFRKAGAPNSPSPFLSVCFQSLSRCVKYQLEGLPIRSEYISTNDTKMAMEPDTTEIVPESEHLFIQPTENPSTTELDNSFSSKTLPHRRKGKLWPFWTLWERIAHGKENKALKRLSKDNEHEYEQFSHINDEYISSNETSMTMESAKHGSERVFIQPTPKSSTTGFQNSKMLFSSKMLLHRRKRQVPPLGERVAHGKENKPLIYLSKDNEHEYEQVSQSDKEYISSSLTKMAMESVKPERERLFIQPTEKPSSSTKTTTGFDDSSSETILHRHEDEVWPLWTLWERITNRMENKPLNLVSKDEEHEDKQLSQQDDEYISSNKTKMAMEPDTTEIKPESEPLFTQSTQNPSMTGFDDSKLPSTPKKLIPHRCEGQGRQWIPFGASMERAADGKKKMADKSPYKYEEDMGEQFKMEDKSFESEDDDDDEPVSDDEDYLQDGWVGNGDQMADLVMILRWARAYRVSIEIAGRMLNMKPEIVNKALEIKELSTDPNAEVEAILLQNKPIIKSWWKLGPI